MRAMRYLSKWKLGGKILAAVLPLVPMSVVAAQYDAQLVWNRKVILSTTVSGVVSVVNVSPGDKVKSGDVLVALDDRLFQADVEKAKVDLEYGRQLYTEAGRELERTLELYDRTLLSDHDKQMAQIALAQADARLKDAQAALVQAQMNLEYSAARAPFDAIVVRRFVEKGETVINSQTAKPLVEVAETGVMAAKTTVSFAEARKLVLGQSAKVNVNKTNFTATIQHIGFEPVGKSSDRYEVTVSFATQGKLFRVGQQVQVNLPE
jgi:RND family efflux transporter MFP subunit